MAEQTHLDLLAGNASRVLTITRLFDAPRALVFAAFVDPKHAIHWLGPRRYVMTHLEADARPGGAWRGCMRATETGEALWHGGVYRAIVRNERLAFTFAWEDARRGPETLVTVVFADRGGKTLMRFTQAEFDSADDREAHRAGWESEFDQLDAYVGRRR